MRPRNAPPLVRAAAPLRRANITGVMRRHEQCPLDAMEYSGVDAVRPGARCTVCGVVWPLTVVENADGKKVALGYNDPPYVSRQAVS